MGKISFNDKWKCYRTGQEEKAFDVTLPHDAMLLDERSENSVAGVNTGWYEAQDYTYVKRFFVPEDYKDKYICFEFEGVYHNAAIYINDIKIAYNSYGYMGFFAEPKSALKYNAENEIRVEAVNSDQPNSRWYSGTGIYRPVWLYALPKKHIEPEGIKISTLDIKVPKIKIEVETSGAGDIKIEILDGGILLKSIAEKTDGRLIKELELPDARLWSNEQPKLYTCRVTYGGDIREESFGIRVIECDSKKGFCINGKRVILRGACIHHDNGLLGACAYDFAEERKIRILKENGYNAIRSAHNPCSKAMLKACDELGMLVMDEYVDVWYIHKTKYDYASQVEKNYKEDLKRIVNKDYNHPSVIMYSTGNEVSETAQKRGIKLCGEFTRYLHELDPSRPVTCGVNIFFNFLSSMGFGVYSDKKAEKAAVNISGDKKKKAKDAVGSEFFNNLAGLFGSNFMKLGATLYPCDLKTKDSFANMDIAGYNYGIFRYKHDLKKYPKRLILGSETFCADAYRFWEQAKKNKRIIGDFVWAGMDYLGEVGIGSWEYKDYAPDFSLGKGWVSAGSGRIDLTGRALSEMKYTRVAFELDKIAIGVIPVNNALKRHSPSAWKMTNAIESWSWNGCAGMTTNVEVYARAHHISLFINDKLIGTKVTKNDCRVVFKTKYYSGEVRAIAYDENNRELAKTALKTAKDKTILAIEPEQAIVDKDTDLCYVRFRYTDQDGTLKPLARGKIKAAVEGGELLGFGSACPYYSHSYLSNTADTYYGEALAIIKPTGDSKVVVRAKSKFGEGRAEIKVKNKC